MAFLASDFVYPFLRMIHRRKAGKSANGSGGALFDRRFVFFDGEPRTVALELGEVEELFLDLLCTGVLSSSSATDSGGVTFPGLMDGTGTASSRAPTNLSVLDMLKSLDFRFLVADMDR